LCIEETVGPTRQVTSVINLDSSGHRQAILLLNKQKRHLGGRNPSFRHASPDSRNQVLTVRFDDEPNVSACEKEEVSEFGLHGWMEMKFGLLQEQGRFRLSRHHCDQHR
jgi:hypothetical protein